MPAGLHAAVQDADDFHDARPNDAIKDEMRGIRDGRLAAVVAAVAYVEAANAGNELGAIGSRNSFRVGRDAAHRGCQERAIADAGLLPVKLSAPPQDRGDVGLRRLG